MEKESGGGGGGGADCGAGSCEPVAAAQCDSSLSSEQAVRTATLAAVDH